MHWRFECTNVERPRRKWLDNGNSDSEMYSWCWVAWEHFGFGSFWQITVLLTDSLIKLVVIFLIFTVLDIKTDISK